MKTDGQMRRLIDRLNQFGDDVGTWRDARRREIFVSPMPADQELAELDDEG